MTANVLIFSLTDGQAWAGRAIGPTSIANAVTTVAQGFKLFGPATAAKIQRRLSHWPEALALAGFSALVAWS